MAITFALYDFKQRMQLIFMIIIVIDIVGHIIIQNRHNMDAVGRLCVDKLIYVIYRERYNLLSNLKSRFFSERDTEKKNIKAKKNKTADTHVAFLFCWFNSKWILNTIVCKQFRSYSSLFDSIYGNFIYINECSIQFDVVELIWTFLKNANANKCRL